MFKICLEGFIKHITDIKWQPEQLELCLGMISHNIILNFRIMKLVFDDQSQNLNCNFLTDNLMRVKVNAPKKCTVFTTKAVFTACLESKAWKNEFSH